MMTDIILTSYFRKDFTIQTIQHIFDRTAPGTYRLIVVDNGSTDGTQEWLKANVQAPHVLVLLSENIGLERAKNIGLSFVVTSRFCDTDNDILCPDLKPDWLSQLHKLMTDNPNFAAIALRPQVLVGVGAIFKDAPEVKENNVCGGSLRLMRTAEVKMAGGWRNEFTNRSEEWEICGKLKTLGFKVGYARDLFCLHLFGQDERWGYKEGVDHSHKTDKTQYVDSMFDVDPVTMVPKHRHNE